MVSKKFIINADDFGLAEGVNRAVVKAHTEGVLTSATIMTNMANSEAAVKLAKTLPSLGVGVHMNLTEGAVTSKDGRVKCLADMNGEFALGTGKLFLRSMLSARVREAIRLELESQIGWLIERGLKLTHIDSHKHIHTIPAIFKIVAGLAEKYDIRVIRGPIERQKFTSGDWPRPTKKGLKRSKIISTLARVNRWQNAKYFKADGFLGIAHTGEISVSFLKAACLNSSASVVEIMTHPGFVDGLDPAKTRLVKQRECELNALCSEEIKLYFKKAGIELVHYGQL